MMVDVSVLELISVFLATRVVFGCFSGSAAIMKGSNKERSSYSVRFEKWNNVDTEEPKKKKKERELDDESDFLKTAEEKFTT
jgi:hypothetical protein